MTSHKILHGLIGYARVSTGGQSVQRWMDGLRKAGCAEDPGEIRLRAGRRGT
jgi:hypothetical protein